jgi:murein DD-endopeptidase MepM/ murein hydrolase activator NlpD
MKKSHFKIIQTTVIPVVIISLSIGGCTSKSPAQIEDRHNMVFTKHGTMEIIRVYPNDTIESIAQQHHIPVEILAATNNLSYPYHLYNVRTIMLPQEKFHKVKKSESMKSIAKQYNVDLMYLIDLNGMNHVQPNKTLQIGTIIKIPLQDKNIKQHVQDDSLIPAYSPTKDYDVMELDEVQHNTPMEQIDNDTQVDNDTQINNDISNEDNPPEKQENKVIDSGSLEFENDLQKTLNKSEEEPQATNINTQDDKSFKVSTPLNSTQFIWPLSGTISRDKKDGITIYAPLNTPVRSVGNGKVIFAENDNGEYGNLVIIKHTDGYLSAYAHNNQILVKKGEEVKKGQTISKVGKSGKVSKTQLYFSMRKGKEIIDTEKDSM